MSSLLKVHQLDQRMQFNPNITTGYRPHMPVKEAFHTFFHLHNESFNMWSHAVAACFILYLMVFPPVEDLLEVNGKVVLRQRVVPAEEANFLLSASPTVVFRSTCLMAFVAFVCSVAYHILIPCGASRSVWVRLLSCDAIGTVLTTTGTAWSFLYRGNACASLHTSHRVAVLLLLLSAAALTAVLRCGSCSSPSARGKVMGFFSLPYLALVLWMEVPKAYTQGHCTAVNYHTLSWVFIALGTFVNASRFPEVQVCRITRCTASKPEKRSDMKPKWWRWLICCLLSSDEIDYAWNSHNIWHYCVILSVIAKLLGCRYDMVEFELARCVT
ncbi:hemolysin-III related [Trypanosoma brucei equiperdum]|uniref:Hemolysin-III related n=1 Tax=Trypanosoma brucei equiperdum TaxID=630700 RepID=A0A3L6L3Z3_9TRYP|nr:hemolysin-III related [Trypanosoma brucei equiperdum]